MDLTEITNIITSVGFPIVMCLMLFKYLQDESDKHETEVKSLNETINSNTQVLTELVTLIKTMNGKSE